MPDIDDQVLEWIEARRDKEQVVSTYQCAEDLKTLAYSRVVVMFECALRKNLIGWDEGCFYTIPREARS